MYGATTVCWPACGGCPPPWVASLLQGNNTTSTRSSSVLVIYCWLALLQCTAWMGHKASRILSPGATCSQAVLLQAKEVMVVGKGAQCAAQAAPGLLAGNRAATWGGVGGWVVVVVCGGGGGGGCDYHSRAHWHRAGLQFAPCHFCVQPWSGRLLNAGEAQARLAICTSCAMQQCAEHIAAKSGVLGARTLSQIKPTLALHCLIHGSMSPEIPICCK
jgi:hypothetical protein